MSSPSMEQVLQHTRRSVGTVALAFMGMGEFAREMVSCAQREYGMDEEAICRCRDAAILRLKDSSAQGCSLEDEAFMMNGALEFVMQYLDFEKPASK